MIAAGWTRACWSGTLKAVSKLPSKPAEPDAMSFEDALGQVETIIERIESGGIGLEASVSEYEQGVSLLRRCQEILAKAEQRVEMLNKGAAGVPRNEAAKDGAGQPDDDTEAPF
jgi:exodeoxyribonuclease VII small subunit